MEAQECNVLKGFSISNGWEYPEKLGNALAHKVFKLFRTFLGHPGGTAGPASRPPRAAQRGVTIFFHGAGRPGRCYDLFFTDEAEYANITIFQSCEMKFSNTAK